MDIFIIRHTEAVKLGEHGVSSDEERLLTESGREQAKILGKGMQARNIQLDKIVTSPLLRARQTAESILEVWDGTPPSFEITPSLAPDAKAKRLAKTIQSLNGERVALVGHMPHIGEWTAWLIGSRKAQIDYAKGGVGYLRCPKSIEKGAGQLRWLVTPDWWQVVVNSDRKADEDIQEEPPA